MKRFYTLWIVLLVLSSLLLSTYVQANGVGNDSPDPATWMPDANLRNAVRDALHLNANESLTQQQLLNLTVLNAPGLGITDLTGLEYATNLRSLSVGGNQISDLTPLANLTGLRALYIGGNAISDINPLAHLTNLRRLGMLWNQITDIHILADLVNLTYLRLEGNPITDTSPLGNLPSLSDVDIEIPSLIRDANLRTAVHAALGIEPNLRITRDALRSLTILNAAQLGIMDLTGLESATNLRSLAVGGNRIRDLTPLANLTGLRALYIGGNAISDINPLAHLTNLRRLGMDRNQVADITVLAGLVNLTYLRLAGNPIANPCPLESLPNLRDVDIEIPSLIPDPNLRAAVRMALGMEASACITTEAMRDLTTLNAARLRIRDLTGLESATHLTHLYIGGNLISDIAPLAGLTHLRVLSVGGNQISDLTPLSSLRRLTELSIANNMVSALSPLGNVRSLKRLEARRNSISDISVLAGLVNLEYLRLRGNPIRDLSPLRNLPKLRDVDVQVFSPPRQGDSGESQPQPKYARGATVNQPNVNQPTTTPQPQQHQQPAQNGEPQSPPSGGTPPPPLPELEPYTPPQEYEPYTLPNMTPPDCNAPGVVCLEIPTPTPEAPCTDVPPYSYCLGGGVSRPGESVSEGQNAPSHPKNAFLLDRITLEQLDPAALEAQLDTWRTESDGSTLYLRSIALLESVLATRRPDKTHLLPNYPNPFNPETWIPYHLATPSQVEITIYDTRGTVVRHLDLGHQQAGYYTSRSRAVYWDGCNDIGEKVSSGIYFYQLQTDRTSLLRKMLILK